MNKMILFLLLSPLFLIANPMQELLKEAQEASNQSKSMNQEREKRFLQEKQNREKLLETAKFKLKLLKEQSLQLNNTIDTNEKALTELEEKLRLRAGNLGELSGVFKQISSELYGSLSLEATSILAPQRLKALKRLSQNKRLPNTQALSELWLIVLHELMLSAQVKQIEVNATQEDGTTQIERLLFAGPFTQSKEGTFYRYEPTSRTLTALATQPPSHYQSIMKQAYKSPAELKPIVIDPTQGKLLSLYGKSPTINERISQGGSVGYLILGLGIIGLILALYRMMKLFLIERSMQRADDLSPVTQLHHFYDAHKDMSRESLELSIEERLSKADARVDSGLAIIKLLAAVAPLLGLLGTVTGMIATFSAITLFGTGDPKLMAGGISQALVTTVEGLVVAIPLLFAFTLLSTKAKSIKSRLNEAALDLLAKHE